jgi:hypothetical protein
MKFNSPVLVLMLTYKDSARMMQNDEEGMDFLDNLM